MEETNGNGQKPNFYQMYQMIGEIHGQMKALVATVDEHGKRINCVEKVQDEMVGKISIFGAIAGFIGGIITSVIGWLVSNK